MRIYFAHSRDFNFSDEYYKPIEESEELKKETLLFPHKDGANEKNSRDFYSSLDLLIAEVSFKATGLGIELGYAKDDEIPIYCFYKKGTNPSSSIQSVTDEIIEYETKKELVDKIVEIVNNLKK